LSSDAEKIWRRSFGLVEGQASTRENARCDLDGTARKIPAGKMFEQHGNICIFNSHLLKTSDGNQRGAVDEYF
jgi:hypothetical protein